MEQICDHISVQKILKEIEEIKHHEVAMNKLLKYVRRLHKQVKREAFYKDLERILDKIERGEAKFIPEEEVIKRLGIYDE